MRHEFRLADIGEGLEEAEVIAWRVAVGDTVTRDQSLIEVMTDKSNAELPAPHSGTIVELGAAVGDMINVGEVIAVIETDAADASVDDQAAPSAPPTPTQVDANNSSAAAMPDEPVARTPRPKASPSTRRLAAERGIDLTTVTGSGPGGRILVSDLDGAGQQTPQSAAAIAPAPTVPLASPPPASSPPASSQAADSAQLEPSTVPLRGVRRAVAQNMAQSWSTIPHIHSFRHVDAEPLLDIRQRIKATGNPSYQSVTPLAFFVAAVSRALQAFPQANASIDMEREVIVQHGHMNVGVAVAAPHGLVVPVLHHTETLSFEELCVQLGGLVAAARVGTLPRESFQGGTATVTNFGSLGSEQATPLIRPPESVIFGFGSIAERPFVIDGAVCARKTLNAVVAADHRLLDGDVTTALINHVCDAIADPLQLVL